MITGLQQMGIDASQRFVESPLQREVLISALNEPFQQIFVERACSLGETKLLLQHDARGSRKVMLSMHDSTRWIYYQGKVHPWSAVQTTCCTLTTQLDGNVRPLSGERDVYCLYFPEPYVISRVNAPTSAKYTLLPICSRLPVLGLIIGYRSPVLVNPTAGKESLSLNTRRSRFPTSIALFNNTRFLLNS